MANVVDRGEIQVNGKVVRVEIVKFYPGAYGVRPAGATCEPPLRTFRTLAAARAYLDFKYPTGRTAS